MTNLSNSINAYSAETGVVAVLSADKTTVYLTQDEGHDIILTDLDFADVGDAETHKLQVTGMDSRLFDTDGTTELLSGSAVNVFDKAFTDSSNQSAGYADSVIVSGQVNMHASHSFTVTADPDNNSSPFASNTLESIPVTSNKWVAALPTSAQSRSCNMMSCPSS